MGKQPSRGKQLKGHSHSDGYSEIVDVDASMATKIIRFTPRCRVGTSTPSSHRTKLIGRMSSVVGCIEGGLANTNGRADSTMLKVQSKLEGNIRAGRSNAYDWNGNFGLATIETVGSVSSSWARADCGKQGRL